MRCPPATTAPLGLLGSSVTATGGANCTFKPDCDYAKGTHTSGKAATKEECCSLCEARSGCAAGVFDGISCWFKSSRVSAAAAAVAALVCCCLALLSQALELLIKMCVYDRVSAYGAGHCGRLQEGHSSPVRLRPTERQAGSSAAPGPPRQTLHPCQRLRWVGGLPAERRRRLRLGSDSVPRRRMGQRDSVHQGRRCQHTARLAGAESFGECCCCLLLP